MVSVIIPAHNEETVIARCLSGLFNDRSRVETLDVVVVCNGCTDRTAQIARSVHSSIKVLETEIASKSNALNLGDNAASHFPRIYLDADIEIDLDSIRVLTDVLNCSSVLAAAPMMSVDCSGCSWIVRAFYRVWLELPYCKSGMIGSGVYALNEKGRKRFDSFPPITADDGYVRLQFTPDERVTLETCTFTIYPPKTLRGLVAIKTRAHFGNIELALKYPDLLKNEHSNHHDSLLQFVKKPNWWLPILVYIYVRGVARIKAGWKMKFGDHKQWERDNSSRHATSKSF